MTWMLANKALTLMFIFLVHGVEMFTGFFQMTAVDLSLVMRDNCWDCNKRRKRVTSNDLSREY